MKYFKLNQKVYHPVYGEGKVISPYLDKYPVSVQFKYKEIAFTEDGREEHKESITLSQTPIPEIVNKPLEDIYIPFTLGEDLLYKSVISKDKSCKGVIIYQDENKIILGIYNISYEDLLKEYEFLDGKPCGKLGN